MAFTNYFDQVTLRRSPWLHCSVPIFFLQAVLDKSGLSQVHINIHINTIRIYIQYFLN